MIRTDSIRHGDLFLRVPSYLGGFNPIWLATDGPDAEDFLAAATEALRNSADGERMGDSIDQAVRIDGRTPARPGLHELDGTAIDLRGATSRAEVDRRLRERFAPPGSRNEYAAWGETKLEREIQATVAESGREWPHHAEHSLRAVGRMRAEQDMRKAERAAPVEAPCADDEAPAPRI